MKPPIATLIHADLIIDGDGSHEGGRYLVFEEGRITAIDKDIPPGFIGQPIRFDECIVLPLLCDYHLHFSAAMLSSARKVAEELTAWGIAVVWDGGDAESSGIDFRTALDGTVFVHASGAGLSRKGGYGARIGTPVKDLRDARAHIDMLGARGVDYVKIVNSGIVIPGKGAISSGGFTSEELRALVQYARWKNIPAVCHANGDRAVRDAIEAGCATIIHGFGAGAETLEMMAEKEVSFIPTLHAFEHIEARAAASRGDRSDKSLAAQHAETVRLAFACGVRILAGSDAAPGFLSYGSSLWKEFRSLMNAGIPFESVMGPAAQGPLGAGTAANLVVVKGMSPAAVYRDGVLMPSTREEKENKGR